MIVEDFLDNVAKQKKYTFISVGMSTMKHVQKAVDIFKSNDCKFELMHCISAYPFDDHQANLKMIEVLRKNLIVKLDIVVMKRRCYNILSRQLH